MSEPQFTVSAAALANVLIFVNVLYNREDMPQAVRDEIRNSAELAAARASLTAYLSR